MQQEQANIPALDGVRACSILFVLAAHMLPLGWPSLKLNAASGLMGMSLFFCLSGFLITKFLYERPDVKSFVLRRFARIVPLLVVYAAVVTLFLAGRPDAFAATVLFYVNYDHASFVPASGHLWSLCVEAHFYAGIALAIYLFGRRGFWLLPIGAIIVLLLRVEAGAYYNIKTHLRVDEILSGGLLALVWLIPNHSLSRVLRLGMSHAFFPCLILWFMSCHENGGPLQYLRPYFAMGVVGSILFMPSNGLRTALSGPKLRYIATISYALYVWHPLTYIGWLGSGEGWERYLLHRPISFALTFGLAHLSTFTLERTVSDWARARTSVRPASP